MTLEELKDFVVEALDDLKAEDITVLDVSDKTTVTDWLVVATGSSSRHVKSIANHVASEVKKAGKQPLGIEGEDDGEWVLVDLGDIIVHVMQRQVREFYDLESLWSVDALHRRSSEQS